MKRALLLCAAGLFLLSGGCFAQSSGAAAREKAKNAANEGLQDQLVAQEKQLWEAWKNKQPDVWRSALTDDAVFFGEYGVSSKENMVAEQAESVKYCDVRSYTLDHFRVIPLNMDAAILLYEAEQHAVCGGRAVQPFMHGSSVYVRRAGKWLNAFRSEVPPAR